MSGPTETTRARPGQTFERTCCAACGQDPPLVPSNAEHHECEPVPSGFKGEAEAENGASDS